jgi:hypothetical protein
MKNTISLLIIYFVTLSCNSIKPITTYLNEEIRINKANGYESALTMKKNSINRVLKIYSDKEELKGRNYISKNYTDADYNYLIKKYSGNTITEYWTKKEIQNFNFDSTITNKVKNIKHTKKYYYGISKPFFLKNKNIVLFNCHRSCCMLDPSIDFVIIMKKVDGKWVVLEKVRDQAIY